MSDPTPQAPTMEQRRAALVAELRSKGIPLPPPLAAAFQHVPRHLFVPGVYLEAVYRDNVIVTKRDARGLAVSSSSQPAIMAIMINELDVQPGQRVLEIGTGTGYNAAILRALVGDDGAVVTVEIDDEIAEAARTHLRRAGFTDVRVITGDGAALLDGQPPFDRIISTAAAWDLPDEWPAQLSDDGVIVTPLIFAGMQIGAALRKRDAGTLASTRLFPLGFIPLKGEAAAPSRTIRIPGSSLLLNFGDGQNLDEAGIHTLFSDDHELAQWPLDLEIRAVSLFNYYLLFHQPESYRFFTFQVEEGQLAYGLEGHGWGVMSSTSACLVQSGERRVLHVFGGSEAYLTLIDLAERWHEAGQPSLEHCHLRITPAGQAPILPDDTPEAAARVFARPTHTFTLWMASSGGATGGATGADE